MKHDSSNHITYFWSSDFQVLWSSRYHFCLLALFAVIRSLTFTALLWMLDLRSCCRTVFVETGSSRWILSSGITFAAIVLWFLDIIILNEWWSLSLSFGFWPLFPIDNYVFAWSVYAVKTMETVVLGTPNTVAILVTVATAERTPTLFPLWKIWQVSHFAVLSYELLLNIVWNALAVALHNVNKQKNNERYS